MGTTLTTLNIPVGDSTIVQGDTIPKLIFAFDVDDNIDLAGSTIKMQVYKKNDLIIDIGTDVGGITLIDTKTFEIDEVPSTSNTYPVGVFEGDLQIEFSDGTKITYLRIIYTVEKQYTI